MWFLQLTFPTAPFPWKRRKNIASSFFDAAKDIFLAKLMCKEYQWYRAVEHLSISWHVFGSRPQGLGNTGQSKTSQLHWTLSASWEKDGPRCYASVVAQSLTETNNTNSKIRDSVSRILDPSIAGSELFAGYQPHLAAG